MTDLCKDLTLSVIKEEDPKEKGRERIRVKLGTIEETQQIGVTTPQSRRYHVMEATILVLRRVVSEAFRQGLISDSLGTWTVSKPATKENSSTSSATEWDL